MTLLLLGILTDLSACVYNRISLVETQVESLFIYFKIQLYQRLL